MCKKEKSGQEGFKHGSLASVLSLYEAEMGGNSAGATPAASAQAEPSDAAPATLENMQDPSFLMKLQGFAKGKLYKGKQKYQDCGLGSWRKSAKATALFRCVAQ